MELIIKNKTKIKFPTDIINKILVYVGELNNDILIPQYCVTSNRVQYKINMFSDSLWNIQGLLVTKRLYPLYTHPLSIMKHKEVYKYAKSHYEKLLRNGINF
jgi:hypothetical protein